MADPAIEAHDLVKVYAGKNGDVRALDGVSLSVESGTVFGLLGPNGAGKTTTVRVLTTLLRPTSGTARIAGIDVLAEPDAVRRSIGLAGQYAAVDENLTGLENLTLVGRLNHLGGGETRRRATALLERFDLADAGSRLAKTYSGGMRRRLDLAAALVARPVVLFLDEPTTGLDPRSRLGLWDIIGELVTEGTTVLLTTQYLEEADRLADRICVVDRGTVIAEGTSAELKGRLGGTVVEVRMHDGREAERVAALLADAGDDTPTVEDDLVHLRTTNGAATLTDVVRRLDAEGLAAQGLQLREPSLDDVFLSLTGRPAEETAPSGGGEPTDAPAGGQR